MECAVINSVNLDDNYIVSVRLGNVRRQAALGKLRKPGNTLKFPSPAHAYKEPLTVEVMKVIATAQQAITPSVGVYDLDLRMLGTEMAMSLGVEILGGNKLTQRPRVVSEKVIDEHALTHATNEDVGAYLQKHNVLAFVQSALHAVINERPDDPLFYLGKQFSSRRPTQTESIPMSTLHAQTEAPCAKGGQLKDMQIRQVATPQLQLHESDNLRNETSENFTLAALNGSLSVICEEAALQTYHAKVGQSLCAAANAVRLEANDYDNVKHGTQKTALPGDLATTVSPVCTALRNQIKAIENSFLEGKRMRGVVDPFLPDSPERPERADVQGGSTGPTNLAALSTNVSSEEQLVEKLQNHLILKETQADPHSAPKTPLQVDTEEVRVGGPGNVSLAPGHNAQSVRRHASRELLRSVLHEAATSGKLAAAIQATSVVETSERRSSREVVQDVFRNAVNSGTLAGAADKCLHNQESVAQHVQTDVPQSSQNCTGELDQIAQLRNQMDAIKAQVGVVS